MAFWRGETLKVRLPTLISPFDLARIEQNSYTLSMGSEYYCTSDSKRAVWERATKKKLTLGESFLIPAGQFAFLLTAERIKIPDDAMAFISIKASIKFEGLINVSGFHVDPGYDGYLVFSVYNAGPSAVHLDQGQRLFMIWYAALDHKTTMLRKPDDNKTISHDLIKGMSREILSLQSLSSEIAKLRGRMRVLTTLLGVASAIFVAILIGITNDTIHDFLHSKPQQVTVMPPATTPKLIGAQPADEKKKP